MRGPIASAGAAYGLTLLLFSQAVKSVLFGPPPTPELPTATTNEPPSRRPRRRCLPHTLRLGLDGGRARSAVTPRRASANPRLRPKRQRQDVPHSGAQCTAVASPQAAPSRAGPDISASACLRIWARCRQAAATETFPEHVPPVLPPTLVAANDMPDRVAVLLVDSSSRIEERSALQARHSLF